MQKDLPKDAQALLLAHAERGRGAWRNGDLATAEAAFLDAWRAIPEPQKEYDYSQSVARGLVEFYRDTGKYPDAYQWLGILAECYRDGSNPTVEFLKASVHYEAGSLHDAFEVFERLHQLYGIRPFQGKEPKYMAFYRERTKLGRA